MLCDLISPLDFEYLETNAVFVNINWVITSNKDQILQHKFYNLFTKYVFIGVKWNRIEVFRIYLLN